MADTVQEQLDEIFKQHRVVLFLNGTLETPADAESAMARDILNAIKVEYFAVDVSHHQLMAAEIKARSGMPKMAQFFIDGGYISDSFGLPQAVQTEALDKILTQKKVSFDADAMEQMRAMNQ